MNYEEYKRKRIRQRRKGISGEKLKYLRERLIKKFDGICQKCKVLTDAHDYEILLNGERQIGPTYPTIEHIIPLYKEKNWSIENLTLFCNACNNKDSVEIKRNKYRSHNIQPTTIINGIRVWTFGGN